MAERQGFEPWDGINRRWFSRPVLSTTQPPLQKIRRKYTLPFLSGKAFFALNCRY
jgi:hypothetical protein